MASDEYASTVLSIMETLYGLGTTMGPFIGNQLHYIIDNIV
jgi:fucose permease